MIIEGIPVIDRHPYEAFCILCPSLPTVVFFNAIILRKVEENQFAKSLTVRYHNRWSRGASGERIQNKETLIIPQENRYMSIHLSDTTRSGNDPFPSRYERSA
jgi:hypothetical protein